MNYTIKCREDRIKNRQYVDEMESELTTFKKRLKSIAEKIKKRENYVDKKAMRKN
jgi:peptidoglycan hydrolase CwlO-like protein